MTRVFVLCCLLGACDVGVVPLNGGGTDGTTAGGDGMSGCATRAASIVPQHSHAAGGTSNAGQSCIEVGCHNVVGVGVGAPAFQIAGTIFGVASPTTGNPGATVTITPATGPVVTAVTDSAGNFYIASGTLPNPFPSMTQVSVCPNTSPMADAVVAGGGDCNGGGACHGGTQGPIKLDPVM